MRVECKNPRFIQCSGRFNAKIHKLKKKQEIQRKGAENAKVRKVTVAENAEKDKPQRYTN